MYGLKLRGRRRAAGEARSILHSCGVQLPVNKRVAAPVGRGSPKGGAAGRGARGGRGVGVRLPGWAAGEAGGGIPVGPAAYEGAPHPAAVVALHVARHVEGLRASFPHGPVCETKVTRSSGGRDETPS